MAKVTPAFVDKKINELKTFMKEENKNMLDNFVKVVDELKKEVEEEKSKTMKLQSTVTMLKHQIKNLKATLEEKSQGKTKMNNILEELVFELIIYRLLQIIHENQRMIV